MTSTELQNLHINYQNTSWRLSYLRSRGEVRGSDSNSEASSPCRRELSQYTPWSAKMVINFWIGTQRWVSYINMTKPDLLCVVWQPPSVSYHFVSSHTYNEVNIVNQMILCCFMYAGLSVILRQNPNYWHLVITVQEDGLFHVEIASEVCFNRRIF